MSGAGWQASETDVTVIVAARHRDPFSVLGAHRVPGGLAIRCLAPGADSVEVLAEDERPIAALHCRHADGFFEGLIAGSGARFAYRLRARNATGAWEFRDPYCFGPVLGRMDDYLLVEGTHRRLYDRLGWTRWGQVPGYAMRADGTVRELCTFFYKEL